MLSLASLMSADNAVRKAAEAEFEHLQKSQPAPVAAMLVSALASPTANESEQQLAAILARRIIPKILPSIPAEAADAIKIGLLQALQAASASPATHRKLCACVGRLAAEFHEQGLWPELDFFLNAACGSGEPYAHETALSILEHMAPSLISNWSQHGASMHAVCLAGLACAALPVRIAALRLLTALLRACSEFEQLANKASERKALKAIATSLSEVLPQALALLEAAVAGAHDSAPQGMLTALENLTTLAELHPRFFKQALPSVATGLSATAQSAVLPSECRVAAVELLLTLAEGAPRMCTKLRAPSYASVLLDVLVPMMLRLPDDSEAWEDAEPDDGLAHGDGDDEGESEAVYAQEALDRIGAVLDGEAVGAALLERLGSVGSAATGGWKQAHVTLASVAIVSEHCPATLAPHLPNIVSRMAEAAAAAEPRARWAAMFALAVLGDEFDELASDYNAQLLPLIVGRLADQAPRVQSAAAVAAAGMCTQLQQAVLLSHAQELLSALLALLGSAATRNFVAGAVAGALTSICRRAGAAVGSTVHAAAMPLLRQRLAHAVASKLPWLVDALVEAMGALVHAAGASVVAADAHSLTDIKSLLGLLMTDGIHLTRCGGDMTESGEATVHATLAMYAALVGEPFVAALRQVMPTLLIAAAVDPDFSIKHVEEEAEEDDDDYEVSYTPDPNGKGLIRSRVNVAQTTAKIVALRAVAGYADAQRVHFLPFIEAVVNTTLPILQFRFHPAVRASACHVLSSCYRQVVHAASAEGGALVDRAQVSQLLSAVAKPCGEAVFVEEEPEAAEAMLEFFQLVVRLERVHGLRLLAEEHPGLVDGIVQQLRQQLFSYRVHMEETDAADGDDDGDDGESDPIWWNLLVTINATIHELLRLCGASLFPAIEEHLLPFAQHWLAEASDTSASAASLTLFSHLVEFGAAQHAPQMLAAIRTALSGDGDEGDDEDCEIKEAAVYALGVLMQHGGQSISDAVVSATAEKLTAMLNAPRPKASRRLAVSEQAASALGKLLVHRPSALVTAPLVPLWLAWLPLTKDDKEGRASISALCAQLSCDSGLSMVLGEAGANLPRVLTVLAAASEDDDEEVNERIRSVAQGWRARAGMVEACRAAASALPLAARGRLEALEMLQR